MNKYIIILIIILITISLLYHLKINKVNEFFMADIYRSTNCCVIRKRRIGDIFKYFYNKSTFCDGYHSNLIRTIKEGELIDGEPFNMDNCKETPQKPVFGSCRKLGGFQCSEFQTQKECTKYPGLLWDKSNCFEKIPIEINYYKNSVKNLKPYSVVQ
jgi:hypothetical protein